MISYIHERVSLQTVNINRYSQVLCVYSTINILECSLSQQNRSFEAHFVGSQKTIAWYRLSQWQTRSHVKCGKIRDIQ